MAAGNGFTVIVNVCTGPTQLLAVGVTVNTPVVATVPVFVAVNDAIELPLPLDNAPIVGLLFVHVNVVPVTFDVNTSVLVFWLLHTVCAVGVTVIIGVGFTVMVNVCTGPGQLLAVGVTVNIPLVGAEPVLVAVNEAIADPLPLKPMPIVELLFVQVYVVAPVKFTVDVFALLQTVWEVGVTVTVGVAFIVIVVVV
jgi:hypothetical protein